jgi:hypothetical protein
MNKRITPSQLETTVKALKRAIRKEERRSTKIGKLRQEIDALHDKLSQLRNQV